MRRAFPENGYIVLSLFLYVALSLVKMRAYLLDGRFWAEEGPDFFAKAAHLPLPEKMLYVFNGHWEFVANVIVAAATAVDFKYAPLVTTYLSFALQSLPIFLVIFMHKSLGIRGWVLPLFPLIVVGLPQSPEVWANTTNLHFHFSLLAALIAVLPVQSGKWKHVFRLLLLLSGLSGIPANFIAPVLLCQAVKHGERERWIQFSILAVTSAIQLVTLATHGFSAGDRHFTANPLLYWLPIICHQFVAPLFGTEIGGQLSSVLKEALSLRSGAIFLAMICSLPLAYIIRHEIGHGSRASRAMIICAALLSIMGVAAALGDKADLISTSFGARYFFASNVLLIIYALGQLNRNVFYLGGMAMLLISSMHDVDRYLRGPDWNAEYEKARTGGEETVNIWPHGWKMPNFSRD